ncbi:hypothetical protein ACHAQH_006058 [Verticillium albo-atrum]
MLTAYMIEGDCLNDTDNPTTHDDSDSPYRKRQKMTERLQKQASQQTYQTMDLSKMDITVFKAKDKQTGSRDRSFLDVWQHDRWRSPSDADRDFRRELKSRASMRKKSKSPTRRISAKCEPDLTSVRNPSPVYAPLPEIGRLSPWDDFEDYSFGDEDHKGRPIGNPVALTDEEAAILQADEFLDALAAELTAQYNAGRDAA